MKEVEWAITLSEIEKSDLIPMSDVYGSEVRMNFGPDRSRNKNVITLAESILVSTLVAKELFENVKRAWDKGESVNVEISFIDGDYLEIPLERYRLREDGELSELWLWMSVVDSSGLEYLD